MLNFARKLCCVFFSIVLGIKIGPSYIVWDMSKVFMYHILHKTFRQSQIPFDSSYWVEGNIVNHDLCVNKTCSGSFSYRYRERLWSSRTLVISIKLIQRFPNWHSERFLLELPARMPINQLFYFPNSGTVNYLMMLVFTKTKTVPNKHYYIL